MFVKIIQCTAIINERKANFERMEHFIEQAMALDSAELLILPELWDLGYSPQLNLAQGDDDGLQALDFLSGQAQKHQVNIIGGSILRKSNGQLWNTSFIMNKNGNEIARYNKMHLFSPAGEDRLFQAGDRLNVFELEGVKIAVILCYDLRFPELCRAAALSGAKILAVPAAWPDSRLQHWRILNQARAIENLFFVAAANASGYIDKMPLAGHSLLINPWGEILAEGGAEESILGANLQLTDLDRARRRISVFEDRKPDLYAL